MNPDDFKWSEDQQVTVINPTEHDYKFMVHGKNYIVGSKKTVKMAGYIAWVYVYGMATQLSQDDGTFDRWNEEDFRQTYFERIVKEVDNLIQAVEVEEEAGIEEVAGEGQSYVSKFEKSRAKK